MNLTTAERITLSQVLHLPWDGDIRFFPDNSGKIYRPNPGGQTSFHNSTAWARGLFGGRGSGKSAAGSQEAVRKVSQGEPGIVANPDFENLRISTWPALKQWIPWEQVRKHDHRMAADTWEPRQPFTIHFRNGAWILVKGIKDPDSARGPNVNWFWYDEPGRDKTGESFKVAAASVRIGKDPRVWVTGTPVGIRHWLYKYFVLQEIPQEALDLLAELGYEGNLVDHFHASIDDNKMNLSPFFYATMRTLYQGKFAAQELDGKFLEVAEGVVFDTFSPANITAMQPIPGHPIELAFDDGYVDPRVILFIQRFPDRVLVFDEYRRTRQLAQTSVQNVVDRINNWPWDIDEDKLDQVLAQIEVAKTPDDQADPWKLKPGQFMPKTIEDVKAYMLDVVERSKKAKGDEDGHMVHFPVDMAVGSPEAKELHRHFRNADIRVRVKPHKIVDGINKMRGIIKDDNDQRVLQIHPRCKVLLEEITDLYRYPEGDRRDNENPEDKDDHGPEALRHWINLRIK